MRPEKPIEDLFEDRARSADGGQYAIAYALLQQSRELARVAQALRDLGNGDASGGTGAIEGLSTQIEKAAQIIADATRA